MLRRNILLVIGLVALLSGAGLSAYWLTRAPALDRGAAERPQTVSVLAAARALPAGTLLRPGDMRWLGLPPDEVGKDSIIGAPGGETPFVGALARRAFRKDEPFAASDLLKPADRNFLAAVLAPGLRAVTLAVEAPQTASGLVLPGDHVDVILTQNLGDQVDSGHRAVAETVLSDVRVVAVAEALSSAAKPTASESRFAQTVQTPKTITLEVSEADAQKLLLAVQLGKIDLSVRALAVSATPPPEIALQPTWPDDVSAALRAMSARAAKPAPPPPAPAVASTPIHYTLEIMHGAKIETR